MLLRKILTTFLSRTTECSILALRATESFVARDYRTVVFDSPEMRTTRFHALTWDGNTKNQPDHARKEPPSLILQSKFAVEQSRVYIRPGQDIGHYTVHPLCFIKPTLPASSRSRYPSRPPLVCSCRPSLLVASFIYLSNIDRELFLCPSRASRKKKNRRHDRAARGRSSR